MDFRLVNAKTLPQAMDLWDECFEKKGTPFYEWYHSHYALQQNQIIGGFENDQLMTMLHLNPYVLHLREKEWKIPYIVGVATDPVARGSHVMGQLLETTFTMLRAMKVPFVILMPIYAGIYQPYGFAYTHFRKEYNLPLRSLDLGGDALDRYTLRRVPTEKAAPLLAPVYEAIMKSYHGWVKRDQRVWENTLLTAAAEGYETVVVENHGAPMGYGVYNKENGVVNVQEMLFADAPAKVRLLQYMKGFAGTWQTLHWLAADDDLTYLQLPDQQLAPKTAPFMMGRVVNATQCLQQLEIPENLLGETFVLGLKDEQIPLNTMLVKLRFTKEGTQILNTLDDPDVLMDIRAFTQLFFGALHVQALLRSGMVYAANATAAEKLEMLFPKNNNWINEYF